jgi:hypothetical protein
MTSKVARRLNTTVAVVAILAQLAAFTPAGAFCGFYAAQADAKLFTYRASLPERFKKEAQNLAGLTGWDVKDIRTRMEAAGQAIGKR